MSSLAGRVVVASALALVATMMRSRGARALSDRDRPRRQLHAAAATLSFSVLADSALEHYRAGFYNRAMYVAPTVSAATLALASRAAVRPTAHSPVHDAVFAIAALVGLIGFGFHLRNTSQRPGGWSWDSVFHGAPVAAPLGIQLAGVLGLVAGGLPSDRSDEAAGTDRTVLLAAALAAAGLLGTAAEAGVLHFRGAFHDPFMFVPLTLPPLAGATLLYAVAAPHQMRVRAARSLLYATVAAGMVGTALHVRGVQRRMGGWRNWSQNLLAGPPVPAPPSFTGFSLAGLASLNLLERARA